MTKLINVEYIDQSVKYPTGCETISTIMCLKYWKINITPDEFIDKYLDKGDVIKKDDQIFAPNPFDKFVGSPYDQNSFGCCRIVSRFADQLCNNQQRSFSCREGSHRVENGRSKVYAFSRTLDFQGGGEQYPQGRREWGHQEGYAGGVREHKLFLGVHYYTRDSRIRRVGSPYRDVP